MSGTESKNTVNAKNTEKLCDMTVEEYACACKGASSVFEVYNAQTLYLDVNTRYTVVEERRCDSGFSLYRCEKLMEEGVDPAQKETSEFTDKFISTIGQRMSIHTLSLFIEELTKVRDQWERERTSFVKSIAD